MREAAIVSTARTAIGKAYRGAFNATEAPVLAGHVMNAVVERAGIDPARIEIADLSRTVQDPLLAKVRSLLRKEYGFTRDPKKKFGIPAVFSTEPVRHPERGDACALPASPAGLNCAGYGSSVCVTAAFGFFAASVALRHIAHAGTGPGR